MRPRKCLHLRVHSLAFEARELLELTHSCPGLPLFLAPRVIKNFPVIHSVLKGMPAQALRNLSRGEFLDGLDLILVIRCHV